MSDNNYHAKAVGERRQLVGLYLPHGTVTGCGHNHFRFLNVDDLYDFRQMRSPEHNLSTDRCNQLMHRPNVRYRPKI